MSIRVLCWKIMKIGLKNRGHWISYESCCRVNLAMWILAKKGIVKLYSNKQFML